MNSSTRVSGNTIASKSIAAKAGNAKTVGKESRHPADLRCQHLHGPREDAMAAAVAASFVMRSLTPALAKVEIHSTRLAGKAAGATLTGIGGVLARVGAACIAAAERTKDRRNTTEEEDR